MASTTSATGGYTSVVGRALCVLVEQASDLEDPARRARHARDQQLATRCLHTRTFGDDGTQTRGVADGYGTTLPRGVNPTSSRSFEKDKVAGLNRLADDVDPH